LVELLRQVIDSIQIITVVLCGFSFGYVVYVILPPYIFDTLFRTNVSFVGGAALMPSYYQVDKESRVYGRVQLKMGKIQSFRSYWV